MEIFGRTNQHGTVTVLDHDGYHVTRIDADVYPVGSTLSARYEHAAGIALTLADAKKINLPIYD